MACFKVYPTPEDGCRDVLVHLFKHRPGVRAAIVREKGVEDFARAMYFGKYGSGHCPLSVKEHGASLVTRNSFWGRGQEEIPDDFTAEQRAAGGDCDAESIHRNACAFAALAREIAESNSETLELKPETITRKLAPWLALAALGAGGWYLYNRQR